MNRVLVLAAHPDDEVLGMGGTIAVHARLLRDAVRIVCVTDGSSAQYPGDEVRRRQKNEEALRAAAELGVDDYIHLNLPDMRLDTMAHVDVNAVVEAQVRAFSPDVVYSVHRDINLDHRAVFDSAMVATRPVPGQPVRRVLAFAPTSSSEWSAPQDAFHPNWFVDVSETLECKIRAFAHYKTEQRAWPHPRSGQAVRASAAHFGAAIGCGAAEPFVLIRAVGDPA